MKEKNIDRRTFLKGLTIATGGLLIGGIAYSAESNSVDISRERVHLPNMSRKLRVVSISDVHARHMRDTHTDLINTINAASPDIFILAGDIIDRKGNEGLVGMFAAVKASYAKIGVVGNWEYCGRVDLARLGEAYEDAGVSLLINSPVETPGLTVVGLDDILHGSPDYHLVARLSDGPAPLLVVVHCPKSFSTLTSLSNSPMVVLSGHTHGGQIAPLGIVLMTPEGSGPYVKGWYRKGNHSLYVMRGIGTTPGMPLRIGASPEILVLDIEGTGDKETKANGQ